MAVITGDAYVPKRGAVVATKTPRPTPAPPAPQEQRGDGLQVALSPIPGFTDPKALGKVFWLQVSPLESMPQDYAWSWDDYATIGSGMHSNPQYRQLGTWSFQSMFVDSDVNYRYVQVKNVHVLDQVRALKALGDSMRPFQLNFGLPQLWGVWDVAVPVTLRSLHVEERAGETDARYYTVTFTEYADAPTHPLAPLETAGSNTKALQQGVIATLDTSKLPASMKSLSLIAKHYYHDPAGWRVIAKQSGLTKATANEDLRLTYGKMRPPARVIVPKLQKAVK